MQQNELAASLSWLPCLQSLQQACRVAAACREPSEAVGRLQWSKQHCSTLPAAGPDTSELELEPPSAITLLRLSFVAHPAAGQI